MAKKRNKRKSKEPENESYEIVVEDWEVNHHFGLNTGRRDIFPGDYWEYSTLGLIGEIISPDLRIAKKAIIWVMDTPELEGHWKEPESESPPLACGWMEVARGEDTLHLNCSVPSRLFNYVFSAVCCGKIRHVHIFGTKLKWRKGKIFDVSFSTIRDEE